ncbi:MAG: large protein, partial [Bacteroidetes bacterium]|nr:large protein [Bacteroidota bacterium]
MKKFYLFFLPFVLVIQPKLFSQQTTGDPYKALHEKIWGERHGRTHGSNPNALRGMISPAGHAHKITGTPVSSLSDQDLKSKCTFFAGDSLAGFDFNTARQQALNDGCKMLSEFKAHMLRQQVTYVKGKYNISTPNNNSSYPQIPNTGGKLMMPSLCNNIDFEDGVFTGWTGVSGYNANSNNPLTVPASALTVAVTSTNQNIYGCADINMITSAYGNDPVGGFPGKDPNGGLYSVRLGGFDINTDDGDGYLCASQKWNYWGPANGEYLEKTITVSAANSLLSFDFAVVLNDGGHPNGQQPYFHVFVTNTAGVVLSSCTQYYVQAAAGVPPAGFTNSGFVNTYDGSLLYYKGWTSNSINLTPYIGSNVKIRFVAAGCSNGGHMGWAYVDAICDNADINTTSVSPCVGTNVTLTAPAVAGGTYLWTGPGVTGSTSQSVTVSSSGTYTVAVTPSQGALCSYTLTRVVTFNPLPSVSAAPTGSLNCTNVTTQIGLATTTSPAGFITTGPGVTGGSTTSSVTVNQGGTYNYTVTDQTSGCATTGAVNVTQNTTAPGASINAPSVLNCNTTSQNLVGNPGSGVTYNWTGPSGFTSTNGSPNITLGGTYNLTVTSTFNGCTSTANTSVTQNTTAPSASINAPTVLNCTNTAQNLVGNPGSGVTYTWSGPSSF